MARKSKSDDRLALVSAAVEDEMIRFNKAIENGKIAILKTGFGPYVVTRVRSDFWYCCYKQGIVNPNNLDYTSFCGCNDEKWADLMQQVGERRNALFAMYS